MGARSGDDRLVHHPRRLIGGTWRRGLVDRAVAWCAVFIGLRRITTRAVIASRIDTTTTTDAPASPNTRQASRIASITRIVAGRQTSGTVASRGHREKHGPPGNANKQDRAGPLAHPWGQSQASNALIPARSGVAFVGRRQCFVASCHHQQAPRRQRPATASNRGRDKSHAKAYFASRQRGGHERSGFGGTHRSTDEEWRSRLASCARRHCRGT